jgi:hypothetical protein
MKQKRFYSRKQENEMQSDEQLFKEIAEYKEKEKLKKPTKKKSAKRRATRK